MLPCTLLPLCDAVSDIELVDPPAPPPPPMLWASKPVAA